MGKERRGGGGGVESERGGEGKRRGGRGEGERVGGGGALGGVAAPWESEWGQYGKRSHG